MGVAVARCLHALRSTSERATHSQLLGARSRSYRLVMPGTRLES